MEFHVPELGEGVYEAELVEWLVKPGQQVNHGDSLAEVMTDKASMEIPSPFQGQITELKAEEGQQIQVGQVVLSYQEVGTGDAAAEPSKSRKAKTKRDPASQPSQPTVPETGPAKAVGGNRGRGDNGPLTTTVSSAVRAAPSVRRMARSMGIDLTLVPGSGRGGRVLIDDLSQFLKSQSPSSAASTTGVLSTGPRLDLGVAGTRVKMIGLRRKIAEQMVRSKQAIPHYSYMDECDVSELVRLRGSLKESFARKNVKLTYLAFFVKAAAAALAEVPLVNATLDEEHGEIVLHEQYHIGIAAATPKGLVVPVVKNVDQLSLLDVARQIDRLTAQAREGQVALEDFRGGTFTVTSIGSIGGLISTPVINFPEVGILGVGQIVKRPVYDERGQLRPADLLYLSFSFDHRVVDGAVGATFGNALKRRLQNPAGLLVE